MRIHFDFTDVSPAYEMRWRERMDVWLAHGRHPLRPVDQPEQAEVILVLGRTHPFRSQAKPGLESRFPDRTLTWDGTDFPSGRLPGLYAGLPRGLFEPGRHSTFCYPFRWNREIRPRPPQEAVQLAGFLGAVTSPLRARLIAELGEQPGFAIAEAPSLWTRMDDPAALAQKRIYADHLAGCRFALCPRGNGVSSYRLFEALETGRVPVVLSDRYQPPDHPAWPSCVLQPSEHRLDQLPALLADADRDWPARAAAARTYWEENYADDRMASTLATALAALLPARPHGPQHRARLLRFSLRQGARDAARCLLNLARR